MGRKAEDLTGQKFNKLTVLRRATEEEWPRGKGRHAKWLCICDCGNTAFVQSSDLKNGGTKSCGCVAKESAAKLAYKLGKNNTHDLTGQVFGKLKVLYQVTNKNTPVPTWVCQCSCGNITEVRASNLKTGHTTSCGCNKNFGRGKTSSLEKHINTILLKEKISFVREKTFEDLKKHNAHLRFDFYIPSLNCCLEVQGRQHYEFTPIFHKNNSEFQKRQGYDRLKISYCLTHNIKLYIIPFWEIKKVKNLSDILQNKYLAKTRWKNDDDWREYKKI